MLGRFFRAVHRTRSTDEATKRIEEIARRIDARTDRLEEQHPVADALSDIAKVFHT